MTENGCYNTISTQETHSTNMPSAAPKIATYEDLLQVPDHLVAEIIHGQLHTHPRPAPRHARASSSLGDELLSPFDKGRGGPGGWWILDEPELHLGDDIFVPDLAGWKRERMPNLPETAWFELEPDWVCEVISPSTGRVDRAVKMPLYAHYGVEYLWLVDPDLKTLEAYQLQRSKSGDKWLLLATLHDDQPVSLLPFDAIEFDLSLLWR
jgi:Uma2 family endonuclease